MTELTFSAVKEADMALGADLYTQASEKLGVLCPILV
jgi:hypothetical protein